MTYGITDNQHYSDIADAIRSKRGLPSSTKFTPSQMANAIMAIDGDTPTPPTPYHWTRPSAWPDLDSVFNASTDKNVIWMTVDATGRFQYPIVKFSVITTNNSSWTVQTGTISNGVFTAATTETVTSGSSNYWSKEWTASAGYYPVIKVTASGGIKNITHSTTITTNAGTRENGSHVVEWIGHADYVFTSKPSIYTIHEAIGADYITSATALVERYLNCDKMVSLDLSRWNTSNWNVTSLKSMFYSCYSLKELNVTGWDTSNWAVTSLEKTWYYCSGLKSLDLSGWNTDNWAVTTLSNTWYHCDSLITLSLTGWNTENWAVTTLENTWYDCYNLETIDISGWDTSNWAVTAMNNIWSYCYQLKSLDLSGWNTSGWAVTTMNSAWSNCISLETLNVTGWDTSNWAVTNIAGAWSNCRNLRTLDLSDWNTDDWVVTSLASTWNSCNALITLDLTGWNTENWAVSSFTGTWASCYHLENLDYIFGWDTSNWAVKSLDNTWKECYSLETLDLSDWDTSGWAVTSYSQTWQYCYNLRTLDISGWTSSSWAITTFSNIVMKDDSLVTLRMPTQFFGSYSASTAIQFNIDSLSRTSLLSILNSLPTTSSSKTFQIGTNNKAKLTAAEIEIGTNKGWTIS